jgi:transcriptional regulator with GAF, ATPase, and Fis domain
MLFDRNRQLVSELRERCGAPEGLVGSSGGIREVTRMIEAVAYSAATVLVTGESGTGKELVARALHTRSPRRAHPFVALNCGALTETLLESELFGHVKGAFTGAHRDQKGLFDAADGGTIFLDEIGDIPAPTQVRLLRVLQEGEFKRVGAAESVKVDVRVIAATHRELPKLVKSGKFREDLFYRLCVVPVTVPPLRRRPVDVRLLAQEFLAGAAPRGLELRWTDEALQKLEGYDWPGNVRQLRNVVRRALLFRGEGKRIPAASVTFEDTRAAPGDLGDDDVLCVRGLRLEEIEREAIRLSLRRNRGKRAAVVKELGIAKSTVMKRIGQWGLQDEGRQPGQADEEDG